MKHQIPKEGFIQIAIVVEDIHAAVEQWALLLGIDQPDIHINLPEYDPGLTYRGEPAYYGIKMAVIDMPGFVIELIEPDEHNSTFREFLDRHGNGVHHMGFEVGDRRDAIIEDLQNAGYNMRTVGYYPGSSWTVVDSEDRMGVNLNIKPIA